MEGFHITVLLLGLLMWSVAFFIILWGLCALLRRISISEIITIDDMEEEFKAIVLAKKYAEAKKKVDDEINADSEKL